MLNGFFDTSILPVQYWLFFIALAALWAIMELFSKSGKLQTGKKRIRNGPLGNADFATDAELNKEYHRIEFDYRKWIDIGTRREQAMADFDSQTLKMDLKTDEDKAKRKAERDALYRKLSVGLPTEPGLILGDWHVKSKDYGKAKIQNKHGIPKYIRMVKAKDPVTGKTVSRPGPINTDDDFADNWCGGKVMTRVCTDDIHSAVVASSGAGKSAFFLYPEAIYAMACGQSFVITDTKGDNAAALKKIAENSFGYRTLNLDLRHPTQSARYNIMHMVNKYTDLYEACPDKQSDEALEYAARRERYAKTVARTIVRGDNTNFGSNAFFYDSAEGLITSVVLLVSQYAAPAERHIMSVYSLIQAMAGTEQDSKTKEAKTGIAVLLDHLDPDDKIRFFAGPAAQNGGDAQANVVSTAMSSLLAFIDSESEIILCAEKSDIDAEEFCHYKTILFITLPEEIPQRYFLCSLVVNELYNELLCIAGQKENGNKIPAPEGYLGKPGSQRITYFLDEFGTIPTISGFTQMMSAARSRNIFMCIILQGLSQLDKKYGKEAAKIIMDNCKLTFVTGMSANTDDAEYFSRKLGNYTIQTNSVSSSSHGAGTTSSHSRSLSMQAIPLMTAAEIRDMPKGDFLILRTGDVNNKSNPIKTHFDLFLDWGITLGNSADIEEQPIYKVTYASKDEIIENIEHSKADRQREESITDDKLEDAWKRVDTGLAKMLEREEPDSLYSSWISDNPFGDDTTPQ
ncbi:MAG: type IV secretory system conjugative DNA transfer family protein [Lactimicrobium massiliense]|nr:type IV secretory system conjugative DNA transfer family protein [Lactimicrobium massiliense]MDD6560784.1 type IV secretory system conjugative DNA transfer family protein [Lactimicrobium massiliense]